VNDLPDDRKTRRLRTTIRLLTAALFVLFIAAVTMRPIGTAGTGIYRLFVPYVSETYPEPLSSSLKRATLIYAEVEEGQFALGSGFVLDDGVVVTAAHVVEGTEGRPLNVFCNGAETPGKPFLVDAARDVALIAADCISNAPPLKYALAPPDVNMPLFRSGFTFGLDDGGAVDPSELIAVQYTEETSYIPGADLEKFLPPENMEATVRRVLGQMKAMKAPPLMGLAGKMKQGHSGSAVYDPNGALVGMAIIIDGGRNRSFIVPAETILLDVLSASLRP